MKNFNQVLLVLLLCCPLFIFANNTLPEYNTTPATSTSSLSKLFISDYENSMIFIDFAASDSHFSMLSIVQGDKIVKQENISDLPMSAIYEINFDELESGITYMIKLETTDGITINKEFVIN